MQNHFDRTQSVRYTSVINVLFKCLNYRKMWIEKCNVTRKKKQKVSWEKSFCCGRWKKYMRLTSSVTEPRLKNQHCTAFYLFVWTFWPWWELFIIVFISRFWSEILLGNEGMEIESAERRGERSKYVHFHFFGLFVNIRSSYQELPSDMSLSYSWSQAIDFINTINAVSFCDWYLKTHKMNSFHSALIRQNRILCFRTKSMQHWMSAAMPNDSTSMKKERKRVSE